MSWTTPKTNWTANDYFNHEDALRINRNFAVLAEMAQSVYAYAKDQYNDVRISVLFYSGKQTGTNVPSEVTYYGVQRVGWYNRHRQDSDFPIGEYNLTYKILDWFYDTAYLYWLTRKKDYSIINVPTNYDWNGTQGYYGTYYYNNYGEVDSNSTDRSADFYKTYSGIYRNFYKKNGRQYNSYYDYYQINYTYYDLYNQSFLNYSELNTIESRINTIYNRLISYGG